MITPPAVDPALAIVRKAGAALLAAKFWSCLQVKRAERADDFDSPLAGNWALTAPLIYDSAVLNATITAPAGFRTDFASVPRLPFIYLLYGGTVADEAAVIHDLLYGLGVIPRAQCDAVFREAMGAIGVPGWRAWPMWLGVRLFGGSHYTAAT